MGNGTPAAWLRDDSWKYGVVTPAPPVMQTECEIWLGATNNKGYGQIRVNRKTMLAHRVIYERARGPIPEGLELDHLCRTPRCVNPDHLEPVTHTENIRRHFRQITSCPQGHPYDEANTYHKKGSGRRSCRACHATQERERRARAAT